MSDSTPTTPIAAGTRVYSRDGSSGEYVTHTKDGHLVKEGTTVYSADPEIGEDTFYDRPAFWHEVYLKPPVAELHEEVAQLNAQIEKLQGEVAAVRQERWTLDTEIAARKARITQHKQLAQLDDFIAGKITCYVEVGYSHAAIVPLDETRAEYGESHYENGRYVKDLRLLTLFGNAKGDLQWKLNRYSDGSGNYTEVTPCATREQAVAVLAKIAEEKWAKARAGESVPYIDSFIISFAKEGIAAPQDIVEKLKAEKLDALRKQVESAEAAVVTTRERLAKALAGEDVPQTGMCAPKARA